DDVVLERLPIAHVDMRRLLRVDVVDKEIDDWIRRAGLRIRLDVERVLNLREGGRQIEVVNLAFVEAVVRELLAVRRPPHRGSLAKLFAVHPARRAEFDSCLNAAVARDLGRVCARGIADPYVAILVDRAVVARRSNREIELASASRLSAAATS